MKAFNFYSYEDNISQPTVRDSSAENRNWVSPFKTSKPKPKKVKVNPEDILVEYVERVMKLLKQIDERFLSKFQIMQIEAFITHSSWNKRD